VEAVGAALPEFPGARDDAGNRPSRRGRDGAFGEFLLKFGEFGFEFGAGGDGALGGDPGSELAAVGAGGEIGGGLGGVVGSARPSMMAWRSRPSQAKRRATAGLAAMSRALRLS